MYSLKRICLEIFETINDGSEQLYEDGEVNGNFEALYNIIQKDFETPNTHFGQFTKPGDTFEFIEQVYTTDLGLRVSGHLDFKYKGKT